MVIFVVHLFVPSSIHSNNRELKRVSSQNVVSEVENNVHVMYCKHSIIRHHIMKISIKVLHSMIQWLHAPPHALQSA
jgi:hypothetical protein